MDRAIIGFVILVSFVGSILLGFGLKHKFQQECIVDLMEKNYVWKDAKFFCSKGYYIADVCKKRKCIVSEFSE